GSGLLGVGTGHGWWDELRRKAREVESEVSGPYSGAVANTLFMLVMAYDDSTGRMFLRDDRLRVDWPGLGEQEQFAKASAKMLQIAEALGGTYLKDPIWTALTDHSLVSGHPLGGCAMADNADGGVVNHKGQVFNGGAVNADVHRGLYVMDGSVVPT